MPCSLARLPLALVALLLLVPPASGHGGQYQGPQSSAPTGTAAFSPTGGGSSAGTAPSGATTPAAPSAPAAGSRGARGGSTRASGGLGSAGTLGPAYDGWEFWWEANRDRFLLLKHRLSRNVLPAGSPGRLTGRAAGRPSGSERPAQDIVDDVVVPALLAVSASADDRDVLDSAVLALGRSASSTRTDEVHAAAVRLLGHRELSVQGAAALALGVLAESRSTEVLLGLLRDDSAGRQLVGGGAVPSFVRAFAAVGLGLVGDARSAHALLAAVHALPDSERDLKVATVAALGLLPADLPAGPLVESALLGLLSSNGLDPVVRSYAATALGKVGQRSVLPALLERFRDPAESQVVLQSLALALGRLATLADGDVVAALQSQVQGGRDRPTRHFALMALARLGARDGDPAAHAAAHEDLSRLLAREIAGQGSSPAHRSWAALAAGIYARQQPAAADRLRSALRTAFEDERDPSFRGAFAIALALLQDQASAPAIHAAFRASHQDDFRGYAGVALGLMSYRPAAADLLQLCADKSTPATFRLELATSLGLLGDRDAVPVLLQTLDAAQSLDGLASSARALGLIGDVSALEPLLARAADDASPPLPRAFACVALGLLGERSDLAFNAPLREDNNYLAQTPAIAELLAIL